MDSKPRKPRKKQEPRRSQLTVRTVPAPQGARSLPDVLASILRGQLERSPEMMRQACAPESE